jgi:hypothetical protein
MAVELTPPSGADVVRVSVGARTYEATGSTWLIEEQDADDLRRSGWRDAPAGNAPVASPDPVVIPTPEATDANP